VPYDAVGLDSLSLTLGVIVLVLWGGVWAMRRLRPGSVVGNARDCSIVRSLALGPRERLLVVQVGTRHLVIGVGSTSVSLLCELEAPLPLTARDVRFADTMRKTLGRWRGG
jgi:flagellar protein FliO/FliZ